MFKQVMILELLYRLDLCGHTSMIMGKKPVVFQEKRASSKLHKLFINLSLLCGRYFISNFYYFFWMALGDD